MKRVIGYAFPWVLTVLFIDQYTAWDFDDVTLALLRQLLKASGMTGTAIITLTFLIGPLSRFWKPVNHLKIFRRYWGLFGAVAVSFHIILAYLVVYEQDLLRMFSLHNPYRVGFYLGLTSFLYFFLMSITSNRWSMERMGRSWKYLQTGGYGALLLAFLHIVTMETQDGRFLEQRFIGRLTFALVAVTLTLRFYVAIWVYLTKPREPDFLDIG